MIGYSAKTFVARGSDFPAITLVAPCVPTFVLLETKIVSFTYLGYKYGTTKGQDPATSLQNSVVPYRASVHRTLLNFLSVFLWPFTNPNRGQSRSTGPVPGLPNEMGIRGVEFRAHRE